jgi:hypothetical protein
MLVFFVQEAYNHFPSASEPHDVVQRLRPTAVAMQQASRPPIRACKAVMSTLELLTERKHKDVFHSPTASCAGHRVLNGVHAHERHE